ncbi:HEPN/Toprim-associated domain-containing protein [Mesorhizobium sp. M0019]|uniref:HEPN/Toprim-associated domain-containing protein n=1 Tax=Mesorhizobium sp. M0019 TaxID=2956845 RepID=UPI0033380082
MGTSIELEIAGVSIDYAKNHMGIDHGALFQPIDETVRVADRFGDEDAEGLPDQSAFCRLLSRIIPRLDLLGHTLQTARQEYQDLLDEDVSYQEDIGNAKRDLMSFEEYCEFACRRPLALLDHTVDHNSTEETYRAGFPNDAALLARLPQTTGSDLFWSEASYFRAATCILSAYSMLQVFATLEANLDAEVVWQYGPIVDAGWVSRDMFQAGVRRRQTTLIATEGTSDARILKHALDLIRPDVGDFFRFVDVNESHPFSGTGNLKKFAEGLVRIDVHNQVIVLLDNDAEGVDACRRIQALAMPRNMTATLLPDEESFRAFPARGPEGDTASDINGRAASIECYLDLKLPDRPPAYVLWSNYKKEIDAWQGALEFKGSYVERFLELKPEALSGYEVSKIRRVLEHLIAIAIELAMKSLQEA